MYTVRDATFCSSTVKLLFLYSSSLERDCLGAELVSNTVQRVRVTEHILPTVLSAADQQNSTTSGIQDLEQLERRMLLQEVKEIRQKSRQSLMEPILEESELAFRSVWSIKHIGFRQSIWKNIMIAWWHEGANHLKKYKVEYRKNDRPFN